jgi:hypothetical protein
MRLRRDDGVSNRMELDSESLTAAFHDTSTFPSGRSKRRPRDQMMVSRVWSVARWVAVMAVSLSE